MVAKRFDNIFEVQEAAIILVNICAQKVGIVPKIHCIRTEHSDLKLKDCFIKNKKNKFHSARSSSQNSGLSMSDCELLFLN